MKRYRKEKNSQRKPRANKTGDWGEHEQAPWLMRTSPSSCPGDTRVWGCMRSRHRAVLVHPQSKAHRGSAARDLYRQMMGKSGDGRNFDIHITRMGCKGYGPGNSCSALWECSGAVQGMERCGGNARRRRLPSDLRAAGIVWGLKRNQDGRFGKILSPNRVMNVVGLKIAHRVSHRCFWCGEGGGGEKSPRSELTSLTLAPCGTCLRPLHTSGIPQREA